MEKNYNMLKSKLLEIYNIPNLSSDEIYDTLLCHASNEPIMSKYHNLLYSLCLYLYHQKNNIETLSKHQLPFSIRQDISFDLFYEELEKYKLYSFENSVIPNDTYYNLIFRALFNKGKVINEDNWVAIQKNSLENKEVKDDSFAYKIYLPIANESLELFSMKLISKCINRHIDYDFKINNDESISRSDNVVIYATSSNYKEYIEVINELIKSDTRIKVNYDNQHPLAYPYNNIISIAPYTDYNKESYTSILCNRIYEIRKGSITFEEFYNNVINLLEEENKELKKNINSSFEVI